ncbi:MAG: hypothetical protein IKE69_05195 [Thermoguttaceae bacterium]|nr:hypothetical protein [Thermoguttaceae bacterium]
MENKTGAPDRPNSIRTAAFEVAVIFLLCLLYGFWPVPDVNEPYYVGKAIHFWNSDYFAGDPFLSSSDSHYLFYAVFGIFSLFLKPTALVWFGRTVIWLLTSFGWQRLSSALIPKKGVSILTAAAFLFYMENFHLAGEWVVGGVEGKGFAFPFLFWGLARLVRRRYTSAFILMGIASAFHVLVGGWGVLAAFGALLLLHGRPSTQADSATGARGSVHKRVALGLLIGGAIALIGLLPALALDRGVSPDVRHEAHRIYVFERISHHLVPSTLPWTFRVRFLLLTLLWFFFGRFKPEVSGGRDAFSAKGWIFWNRFVGVSLLFAAVGLFWDYGISFLEKTNWIPKTTLAADMLRFYWFRLSDWTVPAGVALGSCAFLVSDGRGERLKALGGRVELALFLLLVGAAIFVAVKKIFLVHALTLAKAATLSPLFPVPPRPVDAIAFLAALLLFGMFFSLVRPKGGGTLRAAAFALVVLVLAFLAPLWGAVEMTALKTGVLVPRSNPPKESISNGWLDVCRWAREKTSEDAVFLVPRGYESWKWNAQRAEVANWKEIPQDASSMVRWFALMEDLYTTGLKKGKDRWNDPLVAVVLAKGEKRIALQAEKYKIDYYVVEQPPYNIASQPKVKERFDELMKEHKVYQNSHFIVFQFERNR